MGLLDSVLGAAGSFLGGQNSENPLVQSVLGMLSNNSNGGGLSGLIQQFEHGGLGAVMQSWISTGHNLPISPEQLQSVLGNQQLQQLASQAGIDVNQVSHHLSTLLPQIVDKLTPQGEIPSGGLGDVSRMLQQLLANK